ncbi:glucokinase [Diplodia seriata]
MGAKSSRIARKPAVVEAKRIAAEFDVSAEDVRKTVAHFVRQMGPIVELHGDRTFSIKQTKSIIPRNLRIGSTSADLFSFIAHEVERFLKKHYSSKYEAHRARGRDSPVVENESTQVDHLPLGFTFSFTFQQVAIDKGIMARWDKGFDIPDTIGKDVCGLLQEQIDKLDVPVHVTALANDTVGTLMARSYTSLDDGSSILGAVFGTGTNGAYIEKRKNVTRLGSSNEQADHMIINTEWGSFDEALTVLPTTPYDERLNEADTHPGEQMLEKRVSGMYLGELFRLVLVSILENSELGFLGTSSKVGLPKDSLLFKPYGVDTSIMSALGTDDSSMLSAARRCLEKEFGIAKVSIEAAAVAKVIAEAIGRRAARLSGAAIAAVVVKTGRLNDSTEKAKYLDVGVEGALVEHYPGFEKNIRDALRDVPEIGAAGEQRIRIGLAKDGSGVGAALIAMVADKQKSRAAEAVADGAPKKGLEVVQETKLSTAEMQMIAVG